MDIVLVLIFGILFIFLYFGWFLGKALNFLDTSLRKIDLSAFESINIFDSKKQKVFYNSKINESSMEKNNIINEDKKDKVSFLNKKVGVNEIVLILAILLLILLYCSKELFDTTLGLMSYKFFYSLFGDNYEFIVFFIILIMGLFLVFSNNNENQKEDNLGVISKGKKLNNNNREDRSNYVVNNSKDIKEPGIKRLTFNLILILIVIPLALVGSIGGGLLGSDYSGLALLVLLIISSLRFINLGMSGFYCLGLFIPLVNIYLILKLIFVKRNIKSNEVTQLEDEQISINEKQEFEKKEVKEIKNNSIFSDYKKIENLVIDYNDNFLLPDSLNDKLDLAIKYKREKRYIEAFRIYYKYLIPKRPNHPTILYSLAKLVLTTGNLYLAYALFYKVINIQNGLGREEYVFDSKIFIDDIKSAKSDFSEQMQLQESVSGQSNFTVLTEEESIELGIDREFNSEYEYLNFLFDNN